MFSCLRLKFCQWTVDLQSGTVSRRRTPVVVVVVDPVSLINLKLEAPGGVYPPPTLVVDTLLLFLDFLFLLLSDLESL